MNSTEKIPVFIKTIQGKTVCICHADAKKCKDPCERDFVIRDKFDGWQETMMRDPFGR